MRGYEVYAVDPNDDESLYLGKIYGWNFANTGTHDEYKLKCSKKNGSIGNYEVHKPILPYGLTKEQCKDLEKAKLNTCEKYEPKAECGDKMLKVKETKKLTLDEFKEFETDGEVGSCRVFLDVDKLKQHQEDYGKSWEKWYQLSGSTIEYKPKALIVTKEHRGISIPLDYITHFELTIIHEK